MTFTLAIVGRPNVGKSTLFNRLAGKKLAIVDDTPGITRDWREAEGYLFDQQIRLIDTAGLEEAFDDSIQGRMRQQTEAALKQADAVLFLLDGRAGITPLDAHFARWLRKQKIPVLLGVNKCENERVVQAGVAESYSLGLGEPIMLSAAHGHGLDDLYHILKPHFPAEEQEDDGGHNSFAKLSGDDLDKLEGQQDYDFAAGMKEEDEDVKALKLAIVGRPNVGKSTLLNSLLGEQRTMTGPEAGITRDAIAVEWKHNNRTFRLVDTAGMRRKSRVIDKIEKMSVEDSMRAIRLAQIVVLVLDANELMEKQDLLIAEHIVEEGRALVIAVNKWDSVKDRKETLANLHDRLTRSLGQIRDVPIVTISALTGKNTDGLMKTVLQAYMTWNKRTSTGKLNRWLSAMESHHPAPLTKKRPNRLRYITQIKSRPPTFALWVSKPKDLPDTYKRYLINNLRDDFDLPGTPIRLLVRTSKNPYK